MTDPRAFLDRLSAGYQDSMILLAANPLGVFGALPTVILTLILLFGFRRLKSVGENDDF